MAVNVVLFFVSLRFTPIVLGLNVASTNGVGIIGGHKIPIEQAPFMASLRLNRTYHYCGASIIHERFILTAAHCIVPNRQYKVQVGTSRVDEGGQLYEVEKIIKHELYNNFTNDYDICLIKLKTNLTFSAKVNRTILWNGSMKLKEHSELDVTGWGFTTVDGEISNDLQQVKIPIVSTFSCRFIYFKLMRIITKRMLCAGGHGKDSCQGDSGGPLTFNNVQVGIASFGARCGTLPGVYTKITPMLPWINENIQKNL